MNYSKKLTELINKKDGIISSKFVDEEGIPRVYLSDFVKKGILERVERGVYISKDNFDDEMYRLQIKYSQIIFSHETALYFNESQTTCKTSGLKLPCKG